VRGDRPWEGLVDGLCISFSAIIILRFFLGLEVRAGFRGDVFGL
jgi:hypothetical protein